MYRSLYFRKSATTARNRLAARLVRGALRVARVDEVLPLDLVAEGRAQTVLAHEGVQGGEQLRVVLADGDGEGPAGAQRDAVVDDEVGKDLLPEGGEIVVDHDGRDQAGVHHLEQVVVLQDCRGLPDHHQRPRLGHELLVERDQVLEVTTELAGEDLLAGQVRHGGNGRRAGAGDQDLADIHPGGIAEGDELLQLGRHRDLRRHQVHLAVDERRQQHSRGRGRKIR